MAEMRSADVERFVRDANYPANKRELVDYARRQNAPEDVVRALDGLPDQRFNSSMEVSRSMGEESHGRMGSSSMGSSGMGRESSRSRESR